LWAAFTIAGPRSDPTANSGSIKTWRSVNGKFTIDAELVSSGNQQVVLRKLDGVEIQVRLDQLHLEDLASIANLSRSG
jgi:hypothetical protein